MFIPPKLLGEVRPLSPLPSKEAAPTQSLQTASKINKLIKI